jgi:adenylate kinase
MLGAPGSGKGTQAMELSKRLGLPHVASGDLFRNALRAGTPLGLEAKRYMEQGALVPDDVTIQMIGERLSQPDAAEGVILDGFPRTRPQAEALDRYLRDRGARVAAALYINVPEDELLRRLSGRWVCGAGTHTYHETSRPPRVPGICDVDGTPLEQRADDQPETVKARLSQQLAPLEDVVGYYRDAGTLVTVNGGKPIPEVTEALLRAVGEPAGSGRGSA